MQPDRGALVRTGGDQRIVFTGGLRGRLLWLLPSLAAFVSIVGVISYRFA